MAGAAHPILVTSDWQAEFATLNRCTAVLERMLGWIDKYNVAAVLHLGDIKEQFSPVDARVLDFAVESTQAIAQRVPYYILLGNHDMHGSFDGAENFLHILGLAGATVIQRPGYSNVAGWHVAWLPYSYDVKKQRQWAHQLVTRRQAEILAFHAELKGFWLNASKKATTSLTAADVGAERYRLCLGGHLHKYQRHHNVVYVGSPFARDWNDVNSRKGCVLVTPQNKLIRLYTDLPGYHDPDLPHYQPPADWQGHHVRLRVKCDKRVDDVPARLHEAKAKWQRYYPGAVLKPVEQFVETSAADAITPEDDEQALRQYVKSTLPDGVDYDQTIALLLHYLRSTRRKRNVGHVDFLEAKGKNVLTYKQVHIRFVDGLTLIRGQNDDWDGRSNASGKTNSLQLLCLALCGTTFKKQKNDKWTRRGSAPKPAWVAVKFRLEDERVCVVQRGRRPAKLRLLIDGKDVSTGRGIAEVQRDIEQLTGLTWQALSNAVYIDQSAVSHFLYGTEKERFTLLERFQNLERFEEALARVKQAHQRAMASHQRVEGELDVKRDRIARAQEEMKQLQGDIDYDTAYAEWDTANKAFAELAANTQVKLDQLETETRAKLNLISEQERHAAALRGEAKAIRASADTLQQEAADSDALKGTKCPVCGRTIPANSIAKHVTEIKRKATGYNDKAKKLEGQAAQLDVAIEKLETTTATIRREWDKLRAKIGAADSELVRLRGILRKAEWQRDHANRHAAALQETKREAAIDERALRGVDEELECLRYCQTVLHRSGLPAYIGKLFYPRLNRAAHFYSEMFTGGQIQVRFNVTDEGVEPQIINTLGGEDLADQSESERRLASIITSFALRETSNLCNVLILDEPGMGLDPHSARAFANAIKQNVHRVGCVLLVTHSQSIEAALADGRTWLVRKRNGISQLQKDAC